MCILINRMRELGMSFLNSTSVLRFEKLKTAYIFSRELKSLEIMSFPHGESSSSKLAVYIFN